MSEIVFACIEGYTSSCDCSLPH